MRLSRTFRHGGIRLEASLEWERRGPVQNAFLPNGAVILLKQHTGPQARCVVRRGEYVREGTVLGRADGALSANVHSSIPGVVRDIRIADLPGGGQAEAVVVALEGSFERLGRRGERYLWKTMGRNEMLTSLRDRGVVDTEAPGLPLFDLLSDLRELDLLVVNAVECEPYLRAEASLLEDNGAEVMEGLAILRQILSPKKTVVATTSLMKSLPTDPADDAGPVEWVVLEARYPQDMPRQLLEAIGETGRRPGVDAIILKPTTAFAVYEAVVLAKPMVERYVSVGGGALKRPSVLKARIGTPIGDLIEECGGFRGPPARLVLRGALRGDSVHDLDTPITKTSSAVIALDAAEVGSQAATPCIRCGLCAEVCPERLGPDLLFRLVERDMRPRAMELGLGNCIVCGSCGYICPSRVPLVAEFAAALRDAEASR
jgi:Na+-translocating ferredoxin:NAD+ oxidoreductase subunit C